MKFNTKEIIIVSLFVALITIGSKITIPSPIVPFTMQWMFVLLSGLLLGSRLGLTSMIVYTILGLIGVPVFAKGGGIGYILSPTFGYLLGFAAATYVVGKLTENVSKLSFIKVFFASLAGLFFVYLFGVSYLYLMKNLYLGKVMSIGSAIWYGALLFIPSDIISCVLSSLLSIKVVSRIRKIINE